MFFGEYQHTLDAKGRMIMPSRFREELGERFMITKGINQCLFVYPNTEWEAFAQKLRTVPTTDREAQAFMRILFAGACECEIDKQGRILLPSNLRDFAQLQKDAVVIGAFMRVEIWSREGWEQYSVNASDEYESILAKMAQLGI